MTTQKNDFNGYMSQLETTLDEYLVKKAPALPPNAKEAIVQFGPWICLVLLILALPALLFLLGIGTFFAPFSFLIDMSYGGGFSLAIVFLVVTLVLDAMAIPLLMKKDKKGWRLVYYATLLNLISGIIELRIVSAIIGAIISLYILFQVKEYYK